MKRPGEGIPELFRGYHCLDVLTRYRGEDLGGWLETRGGLWPEHLEAGGAGHQGGPGRMRDRSVLCTSDQHCPKDSDPAARGRRQRETGPGAQRRGPGIDVGLSITAQVALCHGWGPLCRRTGCELLLPGAGLETSVQEVIGSSPEREGGR